MYSDASLQNVSAYAPSEGQATAMSNPNDFAFSKAYAMCLGTPPVSELTAMYNIFFVLFVDKIIYHPFSCCIAQFVP